MAFTCLAPEKVQVFKQALKERNLDIGEMLNMSTQDRTTLLSKYVGAEDAKTVNTLFEEKLVLKNKILGLKNWASKVGGIGRYSPEGKAALEQAISDYRAAQQERIFSPKENEAFLNDLADKKLGVHVSRDVAAKVFELSSKAETLKDVNPKMSGVSDEYLLAHKALNDYVESQKPVGPLASIGRNALVIARNNLLMNPATPIKTSIGQIINSLTDYATRRIGSRTTGGVVGDVAKEANRQAWETFRKTGINTASAEGGKLGEGSRFNVSAGMDSANPIVRGTEVAVRKTAQLSNKIAIDIEHNIPFTKFYQKTFFDSANIAATRIAKNDGLLGSQLTDRAGAILKDAARIEPNTQEGAVVRAEAQMQAARVTSTNKTLLSSIELATKDALNKYAAGLGDLLMPIAKIPANILWNGIENAGAGIPLGIRDIVKGRVDMQSTDLSTRYEGMAQFARGIQTVGRTVGVLSAAAYFTSQLTKKDFRTDNYGTHFVKIGNLWINMEYVAAISPAMAGMMAAKAGGKAGDSLSTTAGQYVKGAVAGYKNLPGLDAVFNFKPSDLFTSRGVPAFIPNLLSNRPIERLFFGKTGVETVQQVHQDKVASAQKTKLTKAKK